MRHDMEYQLRMNVRAFLLPLSRSECVRDLEASEDLLRRQFVQEWIEERDNEGNWE